MGDVSIPKPKPGAVGAKVDELIEAGHTLYATVLTGDPNGRTRRPALFIIAIVTTLIAGLGYPAAAIVAIIAMLLLALTDKVVEF